MAGLASLNKSYYNKFRKIQLMVNYFKFAGSYMLKPTRGLIIMLHFITYSVIYYLFNIYRLKIVSFTSQLP